MSQDSCFEGHPSARARACNSSTPDPRAVGAARRWLHEALLGWGAQEVADTAELLLSELVTNVVRHAATDAGVCLLREEAAVRVEVVDRCPTGWVPAPRLPRSDSEGGRGLLLATRMAQAWGVEYSATAKRVWFRLGLSEARGSAA